MKLVFALTAGRTGSAYLAELLRRNLPEAEVHHEILSYTSFGVDTPDISHLHAYNTFGNTPHVQSFWQRKADKILSSDKDVYVETSHILMKAGLVENLASLAVSHDVHFVILTRNFLHTIVSYHERGDFLNLGNMWLWYLDPNYARNIVNAAPFLPVGPHGTRLWYLNEIAARTEMFRLLYANHPHLHFHAADIYELNQRKHIAALFDQLGLPIADIAIPPKQNVNEALIPMLPEQKAALKQFVDRHAGLDPAKLVHELVKQQKVN